MKGFQSTTKRVEVLESKVVDFFGLKLAVAIAKNNDYYITGKSVEYSLRLPKGWVKKNLETVVVYKKNDLQGQVAISCDVLTKFLRTAHKYRDLSEETLAIARYTFDSTATEGMGHVARAMGIETVTAEDGQAGYDIADVARMLGVTEEKLLETMNDPNFLESLTEHEVERQHGKKLVQQN